MHTPHVGTDPATHPHKHAQTLSAHAHAHTAANPPIAETRKPPTLRHDVTGRWPLPCRWGGACLPVYERTPTGAWVNRSTTGRVAAWGIPAGAVSRARERDRVFGGNRGEMLLAGY